MPAREAALLTLTAMERKKAWSDGHLKKIIQERGLDRRDAALATRLTLGVVQNRMLLDFYLRSYSTVKLEKMESRVLAALRLGVYQMLFMTKIPVSAAVSESVNLTRKHSKNPRAAGLVNGILRNLARHLDTLPVIDSSDPAAYLSLLYSHPLWLVQRYLACMPREEVEALLQMDNGEAEITVQVNTNRYTTEETAACLEREGVLTQLHPWLPDCLILTNTGDLAERTAFQNGMVYAQDPAARLSVMAAAPRPGDKLLDVCAAPGGKSFAAAIAMRGEGSILSCDIHAHKKALIEAGAQRLGLDCITAKTADAAKSNPAWQESFDLVIADVPCSGLGVIRKKPEIRYKPQEELADLPALQLSILKNVSGYVRPGGVLLYSTCTLLEEENEAVVRAFLEQSPEYALEGFSLPAPIGEVPEGQLTLWPQKIGTDGFFIARLRRAAKDGDPG